MLDFHYPRTNGAIVSSWKAAATFACFSVKSLSPAAGRCSQVFCTLFNRSCSRGNPVRGLDGVLISFGLSVTVVGHLTDGALMVTSIDPHYSLGQQASFCRSRAGPSTNPTLIAHSIHLH